MKKIINILNKYSNFPFEKVEKRKLIDAYATYLLAISSFAKTEEELFQRLYEAELFDITAEFAPKVVRKKFENIQELDFDFHRLHRVYPDVRGEAIKRISESRMSCREVWTDVQTINSNGEQIDVSTIIEKIKKETRHLSDVSLSFGETFRNNHIMRANGFYDEYLIVHVHSICPESADRAIKIIKEIAGGEEY